MLDFSELDITEENGELANQYDFVGKEEEKGPLDNIDLNTNFNLNEGNNEEESNEREGDGKGNEEENEEEKNEVAPKSALSPKSKGIEFAERLKTLKSENSQYRAELHEKKIKINELESNINSLRKSMDEMKDEMDAYKKLSSHVYKIYNDGDNPTFKDESEMIQQVTGHQIARKQTPKENFYTEEQVAELTKKQVEQELGKTRKIMEIESKWKNQLQNIGGDMRDDFKTYLRMYQNQDFFLDDLYYLSEKDHAPQTLVVAYKQAEKENIDLAKISFVEKARFFDKVNKYVSGRISQSQSKQTASKPITQNKGTKLEGNKGNSHDPELRQAWIDHFNRMGRELPSYLK